MPIYKFECEECKKTCELIVPLFATTQPCPYCGKEAKKVFDVSGQAVIYKGSGWTNTPGKQG